LAKGFDATMKQLLDAFVADGDRKKGRA